MNLTAIIPDVWLGSVGFAVVIFLSELDQGLRFFQCTKYVQRFSLTCPVAGPLV